MGMNLGASGLELLSYKGLSDLLRFGSLEHQRQFANQGADNLDAKDQGFLKGCLEVYDKTFLLLQNINEREGTSFSDYVPIVFVLMGQRFLRIFRDFCLPSLAPELKALRPAQGRMGRVFLFVDESLRREIQAIPLVHELGQAGLLVLVGISENLCNEALDEKLKLPTRWSWRMTLLTNSVHYGALEYSRKFSGDIIIGWPDLIFPPDFIKQVLTQLEYRGVACVHPYRIKESVVNLARHELHEISRINQIKLVMKSLEPNHLANNKRFINNPAKFVWTLSDSAFCSSSLNVTPIGFKFDFSKKFHKPIPLSSSPVDGLFVGKYWSRDEIGILHTLICDISPDELFSRVNYSRPIDPIHVVSCLLPELNEFSLFSLSNLAFFSCNESEEDVSLLENFRRSYIPFRADLLNLLQRGQFRIVRAE
jgi:hypothetical protein